MRRISWMAIAAGCLLVLGFAGTASADDAGKDLFAANKCSMCHSIAAEGITAKVKSEKMLGPDLGGYKATAEASALVDYLTQAADLDGKKHKKKFAGSADDATAILAWLGTLDKAPE